MPPRSEANAESHEAGPLCVALDSSDPATIARIADATAPYAGLLKLGATGFAVGGQELVRVLRELRPVFLDLKLHDIPAQVEAAVGVIADVGARYVTVHASGGSEMIGAAVTAAGDSMRILAVTVLTSLDEVVLRRLGVQGSVEEQVLRLAEVALAAGAHGIVCSPHEARALRVRFGPRGQGGPLIVVPGVRLEQVADDDQKRTLTPMEALEAGADVLVVGRPITRARDPAAAARALRASLGR
jgi:orotidine-5'-phosphate decarboxylase